MTTYYNAMNELMSVVVHQLQLATYFATHPSCHQPSLHEKETGFYLLTQQGELTTNPYECGQILCSPFHNCIAIENNCRDNINLLIKLFGEDVTNSIQHHVELNGVTYISGTKEIDEYCTRVDQEVIAAISKQAGVPEGKTSLFALNGKTNLEHGLCGEYILHNLQKKAWFINWNAQRTIKLTTEELDLITKAVDGYITDVNRRFEITDPVQSGADIQWTLMF